VAGKGILFYVYYLLLQRVKKWDGQIGGVSENIGLVALAIMGFMAISITGQLIKSLCCRFRK
jgi:hypothetical protein